MSKIHFMSNPFPDNHDGFDYSPQSELDSHRENDVSQKQSSVSQKSQNRLMSMLASVFK